MSEETKKETESVELSIEELEKVAGGGMAGGIEGGIATGDIQIYCLSCEAVYSKTSGFTTCPKCGGRLAIKFMP